MKKYFFGLVAVVLAIGFTAFTTKSNKSAKGTFYYWSLKSSVNRLDGDARVVAANYDKIGSSNITCNADDNFLCSIFAEESATVGVPIIPASGTTFHTRLYNSDNQRVVPLSNEIFVKD